MNVEEYIINGFVNIDENKIIVELSMLTEDKNEMQLEFYMRGEDGEMVYYSRDSTMPDTYTKKILAAVENWIKENRPDIDSLITTLNEDQNEKVYEECGFYHMGSGYWGKELN